MLDFLFPTGFSMQTITFYLWDPDLRPMYALIFFLYGLFFGSFFNVAIYRLPLGLSVFRPRRSFCFRCGSPVLPKDNFPLFSWLFLRGRCRSCQTPIHIRYPFVEVLTGFIFMVIFLGVNPPGNFDFQFACLWYMLFAGLLIIATFTDFDHFIIPTGLTTWGSLAGVIAALFIGMVDEFPLLLRTGPFPVLSHEWGQVDGFGMFLSLVMGPIKLGYDPSVVSWWMAPANALLGLVVGPALLYGVGVLGKVLFQKDAMGLGDVYLFALVGVVVGPINVLLVLMMAAFFGALAGGFAWLQSKMRAQGEDLLLAGLRFEKKAAPTEEPSPEEIPQSVEGENSEPLPDRVLEVMKHQPRPRTVHHLPFGPWISLASILIVIFHDRIWEVVNRVLGIDLFML